ncbi:tyrosinase [Plectosphaerella plurivora]|uniref:Tyrosinase n=1 Tax=Plectosphaerella plurivora TaxID=936078 RepID=A0A9P9AAI5_9PEZI|nr:tyrosinase [Plectosphaerella plurivora]
MLVPSFVTALCAMAVSAPLLVSAQAPPNPVPVVGPRSGINAQTGETPARRNINDLYQEAGPQWDLYVQALTAMQNAPERDPTSYFQIAAIHGQPYAAWAGGGPQRGSGGFCPHNEILFGTWHRAYLSLFEQVLVQHAERIARGYPTAVRDTYVNAAARLRAPFWDWAADSRVPPATVPPAVLINRADGIRITVTNPLAGYRYPQSALRGEFGPFNGVNATKRCIERGQTYPATANRDLTARDLRTHVYNAINRAGSWNEISSMSMGGNSIEGPHGTIHIYGACGQDFYYLSTAAFEPLFMLHHANVDRTLAYWQAINPQSAVTFSYQTRGLFGTPAGTTVTERSPVAPFDGPNGRPLTSADVADIRNWGYTYEPMQPWVQSPSQMRTEVARTINRLYGPPQIAARIAARRGDPRRRQERPVERNYFASVSVERGDLVLPAAVEIYVKKHHAGTFALLGMPQEGMSYDEIPLHQVLQQVAANMTLPEDIAGFIQSNMEVNIRKPDGSTISPSSVPSLKILVEDVEVLMPVTEEQLPEYGEPQTRPATPKTLVIKKVEVVVPC